MRSFHIGNEGVHRNISHSDLTGKSVEERAIPLKHHNALLFKLLLSRASELRSHRRRPEYVHLKETWIVLIPQTTRTQSYDGDIPPLTSSRTIELGLQQKSLMRSSSLSPKRPSRMIFQHPQDGFIVVIMRLFPNPLRALRDLLGFNFRDIRYLHERILLDENVGTSFEQDP